MSFRVCSQMNVDIPIAVVKRKRDQRWKAVRRGGAAARRIDVTTSVLFFFCFWPATCRLHRPILGLSASVSVVRSGLKASLVSLSFSSSH